MVPCVLSKNWNLMTFGDSSNAGLVEVVYLAKVASRERCDSGLMWVPLACVLGFYAMAAESVVGVHVTAAGRAPEFADAAGAARGARRRPEQTKIGSLLWSTIASVF